ncbi:MAG: hypothetical protein HY736_27010 [Verrucomicrobia bacterium]|nr:hypothetical protein [Verrucomicrobiota bacterium]
MNAHELNLLHFLHVIAALILAAFTFFAFAAAPETRRRVIVITGVASLVILLTGIRMWQGVLKFEPAGWVIVKLVCWLGLSALSGIAYRKRDKVNLLMAIVLGLATVAVGMVYYRPF